MQVSALPVRPFTWVPRCLWQVKNLVEMGFAETDVKAALAAAGGDENAALEKLCGGG